MEEKNEHWWNAHFDIENINAFYFFSELNKKKEILHLWSKGQPTH